jgi:predicted small lipoprotein YifL
MARKIMAVTIFAILAIALVGCGLKEALNPPETDDSESSNRIPPVRSPSGYVTPADPSLVRPPVSAIPNNLDKEAEGVVDRANQGR